MHDLPRPILPPIVRMCAWCGRPLGPLSPTEPTLEDLLFDPSAVRVSDGICDTCEADFVAACE